jgi:hypothetical protein
MRMTPALASALVTLVTVLTIIAFVVLVKLWNGDFDTKAPKVNSSEAKAADNIFTKHAAEEHRKAAEANERAEKMRLERTKLEKSC